jgi:hypothetical protein
MDLRECFRLVKWMANSVYFWILLQEKIASFIFLGTKQGVGIEVWKFWYLGRGGVDFSAQLSVHFGFVFGMSRGFCVLLWNCKRELKCEDFDI